MNPSSGTPPTDPPVKRKRGRPRKYETAQAHGVRIQTPSPITTRLRQEKLQSPASLPPQPTIPPPQPFSPHNPASAAAATGKGKGPAVQEEGKNDDSSNDAMIGKAVTGVIEGSFGDGYLLSVKVGGDKDDGDAQHMRGIVFLPDKIVPVTAENDIAPFVKMYTRKDIPIPADISNLQQQNLASPSPPVGSSSKPAGVNEKEKSTNEKESASAVVVPDGDRQDNKDGQAVTAGAEVMPTAEKTSTDDHQTASVKKAGAAEDVVAEKDGTSKESEASVVKEAEVSVIVAATKDTGELPVAGDQQALEISGKQSDTTMLGNEETLSVQKGEPENVPAEGKAMTSGDSEPKPGNDGVLALQKGEAENVAADQDKAAANTTTTTEGETALNPSNEEAVDEEMTTTETTREDRTVAMTDQKTEEDELGKAEREQQSLAALVSDPTTLDGSKNNDADQADLNIEPPRKILKTSGDQSDAPSPNGLSVKPPATDTSSDKSLACDPMVVVESIVAAAPTEAEKNSGSDMMMVEDSAVVTPEAGRNSESEPSMTEQSAPPESVGDGKECTAQGRMEQETPGVNSSMDVVAKESAAEHCSDANTTSD